MHPGRCSQTYVQLHVWLLCVVGEPLTFALSVPGGASERAGRRQHPLMEPEAEAAGGAALTQVQQGKVNARPA